MAAAGSLVADGNGKIPAGELDVNASNENGLESMVAVAGNYETQEADDGSQNIRIALEDVSPRNRSTGIKFNAAFPLSFSAAGSGASAESHSILFATTGKITGQSGTWTLTGEIARQDITSVMIANLGGSVFSLSLKPATVFDPVESGGFVFSIDRESSGLPPSTVGIGKGSLGAIDANGRSSLTLTFANAAVGHYAAYAVSSARLFLVALDTADAGHATTSGEAVIQSSER